MQNPLGQLTDRLPEGLARVATQLLNASDNFALYTQQLRSLTNSSAVNEFIRRFSTSVQSTRHTLEAHPSDIAVNAAFDDAANTLTTLTTDLIAQPQLAQDVANLANELLAEDTTLAEYATRLGANGPAGQVLLDLLGTPLGTGGALAKVGEGLGALGLNAPLLDVAGADLTPSLNSLTNELNKTAGDQVGAHDFQGAVTRRNDGSVGWTRVDKEQQVTETYHGDSETMTRHNKEGLKRIVLKGLELIIDGPIKISGTQDLLIDLTGNLLIKTDGKVGIQSSDFVADATDQIGLAAAGAMALTSGGQFGIESGGSANITASGVLGLDGSQIQEQVSGGTGAVSAVNSELSDIRGRINDMIADLDAIVANSAEQLAAAKAQHDNIKASAEAEKERLRALADRWTGNILA